MAQPVVGHDERGQLKRSGRKRDHGEEQAGDP